MGREPSPRAAVNAAFWFLSCVAILAQPACDPAPGPAASGHAAAENAPSGLPALVEIRPSTTNESLPGGQSYQLYRFPVPLERARLDVVDLGLERTLEATLRDKSASVAVNGGFFDRSGQPLGLVIARGHEIAPFAAALGGGVVALADGRAHLHDAEGFTLPRGTTWAVQCRPRLVVDGQVNIRSDDGKRADRTAICLREEGSVLELVIARTESAGGKDGPTLRSFAERLRLMGCRDALNLDGGPSTGAAWREQGEVNTLATKGMVRHALLVHLLPSSP